MRQISFLKYIICDFYKKINYFFIYPEISLLTLYIYKIPFFLAPFRLFSFHAEEYAQTPPITSMIDLEISYLSLKIPYYPRFLSAFFIQDILYLLRLQIITKNPAYALSADPTFYKSV